MHDDFRDHASQEETEETQCEPEVGPVVPVLHGFQTIALEVDIAVKVLLVEGLHRDPVLAMVPGPVRLFVEGEVMFDRTTRISSLFIFSGRNGRCHVPESTEDRN